MSRKSKKFKEQDRTALDDPTEQHVQVSESTDGRETSHAEARTTPRVASELRTIVQIREHDGTIWKEVTKVNTVSRNGAGFALSRECPVGRLVTLLMPMPAELRAYDHSAEIYPILGIVQHCNKVTIGNETVYHVGVALIGKQMPVSFMNDPTQSYRISGMSDEGLWQVTEAEMQFKTRRHPRYSAAVEVVISLIQKHDRAKKQYALTLNVGASGAAVHCSLPAKVGDKVKFACKSFNFYAIAVVRHRTVKERDTPILHLEFIDSQFPIIHLNIFDSPNTTQDMDQSVSLEEAAMSVQYV